MEFKRTSSNGYRKNNEHAESATPKKRLAADRERLGFDDIPIDDGISTDVTFQAIFAAWLKQAFRHSPLEKRLKRPNNASKRRRLQSWKEDAKWALQADLDEPVRPTPKTLRSSNLPITDVPRSQKQSTAQPTEPAVHKTIDININIGSIPKFSVHKLKQIKSVVITFVRQRTKKQLYIGVSILVALLFLIYGVPYLEERWAIIASGGDPGSVSSKKSEKPTYSTVLPSGKSIDQLGGWSRVSPPNRNPVFAYVDKIGDVQINVSEQPLPKEFKSDISHQVENLAKAYTATDKVDAGGTTFYVGTSAKGPQSVIFNKNDLLILIKSSAKIDDKDWTKYVQSLH